MTSTTEPRESGNFNTLFIVTYVLGIIIGGVALLTYWTVPTQRWFYSSLIAFCVLTSSVVAFRRLTGKWNEAWSLTVPLVHPLAVVVVVFLVLFRLVGLGSKAPATVAPQVAPAASVANVAAPKPKVNTNTNK